MFINTEGCGIQGEPYCLQSKGNKIVDITDLLAFDTRFSVVNPRFADFRRICLNLVEGYVNAHEKALLARFSITVPTNCAEYDYSSKFMSRFHRNLKSREFDPVYIWKIKEQALPFSSYQLALLMDARNVCELEAVSEIGSEILRDMLTANEPVIVDYGKCAYIARRDVDFSMAVDREMKSLHYLGRHWDSSLVKNEQAVGDYQGK